ncbi:MAG TPA: class II fructose-bisphosphate aldolase [Pyrinomonadaceae bacterium]|jgi:ketose-bisphosphate aldolase|nr:class II fructose-bisphosphate aldolase [Pyrinomonadaceae bacterium]
MPEISASRPLLESARRAGRAVAALNFYNAETLIAHTRAAKALNVSIILQTTEATISYLGPRLIVNMARAVANEMEQPIALHLDHAATYELAARCIENGYTSVMIDGSKLPFQENVALTRRVTELAHSNRVSVEGELGHVTQTTEISADDRTQFFTRPDDARCFVAETKVDALAVAVGTAHGFYKGEVRLDLERLKAINDAVPDTYLVLHGGTGVPEELLRNAIKCGISKCNFGTELKNAFTLAVKKSLCDSSEIDLRKTFSPAIDAVQQVSMEKIRICNATG